MGERKLVIDRIRATVSKYRHKWADFTIIDAGIPFNYVAVIVRDLGGPDGVLTRGNMLKIWTNALLLLLESKLVEKADKFVCFGNYGNTTYVYIPEEEYIAKFVGSELEYEVKSEEDYDDAVYSYEDMDNIEAIKRACNSDQ